MNSPYKGKFKVTQTFKGTSHDGLDLVGISSKEVHSTISGIVEKAGWENPLKPKIGFGLYVRILKDGSNDKYYFGHLSKLFVKKGDRVKTGDIIGIEGDTGYSFGSHCHYCVRENGLKSQVKDVSKISGIPNKLGTYESLALNVETNIKYQVLDDATDKWLPNVINNNDYAGILGHNISCLYADITEGNIYYRVHTKNGRWLPQVKNRTDYAGIKNKPIDAVMFKTDTGKKIRYRVHIKGGKWLDSVTGYSTTDSKNGYAGILKKEIDAVQIWFE